MIVQNVAHDNTTDFTFTVHRNDYSNAMLVLEKTAQELARVKWLAIPTSPRFPSWALVCAPTQGCQSYV